MNDFSSFDPYSAFFCPEKCRSCTIKKGKVFQKHYTLHKTVLIGSPFSPGPKKTFLEKALEWLYNLTNE